MVKRIDIDPHKDNASLFNVANDIVRSARGIMKEFGDGALAQAIVEVGRMITMHDTKGEATWREIVKAIRQYQES